MGRRGSREARRHRHAHRPARRGRPRQPGPAAVGTDRRYSRYVASGEINSHIADVPAKLDEVEAAHTRPGVTAAGLDGLTVNLGDGRWFNLRPSNSESLLRLNVEAPTRDAMAAIRDEVLAPVR